MLLWRGDKETNETDSRPAMKMRDGGHAYFFQVFTGAAIAGELKKAQDGALRVYILMRRGDGLLVRNRCIVHLMACIWSHAFCAT